MCVFHRRAAAKRTVAIYHTHHHFDYLAPADKGYPDEITQVSADPSGGFLVGGTHSFCSAFTKSSRTGSVKTTWTSQIGKSNKSKASVSRSGPKNAPRPPDSALENVPGSSLPPSRSIIVTSLPFELVKQPIQDRSLLDLGSGGLVPSYCKRGPGVGRLVMRRRGVQT